MGAEAQAFATSIVVEDAKAGEVMAALQAFRDGPMGRRTGIFAYQTPVDAVLAPPAGWKPGSPGACSLHGNCCAATC